MVNTSFKLGHFPESLKTAILTPIIKSAKLDKELFNNYRPVSNLTILSKILEKSVLQQLTQHLQTNQLYCKYQSAYRPGHSCETALLHFVIIEIFQLELFHPNAKGILFHYFCPVID